MMKKLILAAMLVLPTAAMYSASSRAESDTSTNSTLPPCSRFAGKACSGNLHPRCLLIPGEPAVCECINGTYFCS